VKWDARLTLARPNLARRDLEGVLRAKRFADADAFQVTLPVAPLRAGPDRGAEQIDQLLFGEFFDVLEVTDGVAWGQARRDGYVGWVEMGSLSSQSTISTHWVSALRTFAFAGASIRSPSAGPFSLNALVTVGETTDKMAYVLGAGWVPRPHLSPIGAEFDEPARAAARYLGTPYLWGGRDSLGLDCSGLIQQALYAAGRGCPRDADQQASLGCPISPKDLRRGDLVAWPGHIGMMLDARRLLHANAHHMAVAIEPLARAVARIAAGGGGQPTAYRRL
jgi:cell wall-associated NlpC family hydrolase